MQKRILVLTGLLAMPVLGMSGWALSDVVDKTKRVDFATSAETGVDPALHDLVMDGDLSGAEEYFIRNAESINSVNDADDWGMTLLHKAALAGNVEVMNFLLSKGANANARDLYQDTPLHFVAFAPANLEEATWLLVSNGADVNAQDIYGETALHWAAYAGAVGTASVLLRDVVGAKADMVDKYGQTPLDEAMAQNEEEVVELLQNAAQDVRKAVQ